MILTKLLFPLLFSLIFLFQCATFMEDEEKAEIKNYEKGIYILNQGITVADHSLKKGQRIKIYLVSSDESIKVYGYSADMTMLKAERILLLYLFEDDFKEARYNKIAFEKELFKILKPVK